MPRPSSWTLSTAVLPFRATLTSLTERIEKLRTDAEQVSRHARRDELQRWMEGRFPDSLTVTRGAEGRVFVDVRRLARVAQDSGSPAVWNLLRREG